MKQLKQAPSRFRVLATFNLLLVAGCSGATPAEDYAALMAEPETAEEAQSALTGGNRITHDYFDDNNHARALVRFLPTGGPGVCRGLKIGPNQFLTAAPCVNRSVIGGDIDITNAIDGSFEAAGAYLDRTLEAVHVTLDLAVFTVKEHTNAIDVFDGGFDHRYISDGMWARALGQGCGNDDYAEKQWGDLQAYSRSSSPTGDEWDSLHENYIISYTPDVQLCGTDIGGPLIQYRDGGWNIVGVSALWSNEWSGFTRVHDIEDFLDDVHSACAEKCSRDHTRSIQSLPHTDGVSEAISSCIERC